MAQAITSCRGDCLVKNGTPCGRPSRGGTEPHQISSLVSLVGRFRTLQVDELPAPAPTLCHSLFGQRLWGEGREAKVLEGSKPLAVEYRPVPQEQLIQQLRLGCSRDGAETAYELVVGSSSAREKRLLYLFCLKWTSLVVSFAPSQIHILI